MSHSNIYTPCVLDVSHNLQLSFELKNIDELCSQSRSQDLLFKRDGEKIRCVRIEKVEWWLMSGWQVYEFGGLYGYEMKCGLDLA